MQISVLNSTSDYVNVSWNLLNYIFPNKEQDLLSFMEGTTFSILKSCNDLFEDSKLFCFMLMFDALSFLKKLIFFSYIEI